MFLSQFFDNDSMIIVITIMLDESQLNGGTLFDRFVVLLLLTLSYTPCVCKREREREERERERTASETLVEEYG